MARLIRESYKRKLDNDFKLAEKVEGETQAIITQYLCVRVAGYLESCLKEEILLFVEKRCHKSIESYIKRKTQNLTNLTHRKIKDSLCEFSEEWAEDYDRSVSEEMRQSVASIYENRNHIAHGQSCSLGLFQVKRHYDNITKVVEKIHYAISKRP